MQSVPDVVPSQPLRQIGRAMGQPPGWFNVDESGETGESDAIKEVTPEEALEDWRSNRETKKDLFNISGSKVSEGVGQYLVIAIGQKSFG